MEKVYVIASPALAGDFGQCLLVEESLGKYLLNEIPQSEINKDVVKVLHEMTVSKDKKEQSHLLSFLERNNYEEEGSDSLDIEYIDFEIPDIYYYLCNIVYQKETHYVMRFYDIAEFANYVRENNLDVKYIDNY